MVRDLRKRARTPAQWDCLSTLVQVDSRSGGKPGQDLLYAGRDVITAAKTCLRTPNCGT